MLNIIGFNVTWFLLVYLGNDFIPIALLFLIIHLRFISKLKNEVWLIVSIFFIGIIIDSLLQYFNVFIFSGANHIPIWLMVLWACFGTTICHSFNFLSRRKIYQAIAGGVFAPFSYVAGYKLNAIDFSYSIPVTFILLSIIWSGLFVLFFYLKAYFIKQESQYV